MHRCACGDVGCLVLMSLSVYISAGVFLFRGGSQFVQKFLHWRAKSCDIHKERIMPLR